MSLPEIPAKVTDWNIDILNKLITFRDIESDVFDFKGSDFSDLAIHLCAMANNGGGTLVLGIDEDKTSEGHLLGFKKIGFSVGKENFMDREVGNRVFQVEPNPKVEIKNIKDTNDKFYIALQIIGEESRKPYMIKDRAQFFVRINGSTRPASRTVVSNLFVNAIQKKNDVDKLRVTVNHFKEAVLFTSRDIESASDVSTSRITPIDLTFVKSVIISAEWFLRENRLLGKTEKNGYEYGLYQIIHNIESLNLQINSFNNEKSKDKQVFCDYLKRNWTFDYVMPVNMIEFLDKITRATEDFLSKYP